MGGGQLGQAMSVNGAMVMPKNTIKAFRLSAVKA
jgi:hypothetical protein